MSEPRAVATGSRDHLNCTEPPINEKRLHRRQRSQHSLGLPNHVSLLWNMAARRRARFGRPTSSNLRVPGLAPNAMRRKHDRELLKQPPVKLNSSQREVIKGAIRETCTIRHWQLWTMNVRTNHVHAVVTANKKPEAVLSALKANATRAMREARL